jgi:hypothetical protein
MLTALGVRCNFLLKPGQQGFIDEVARGHFGSVPDAQMAGVSFGWRAGKASFNLSATCTPICLNYMDCDATTYRLRLFLANSPISR